MSNHTAACHALYPDVDPHQPAPLTIQERLSVAVAAAVLAYGAAAGNLAVVGVGCVFVLVATWAPQLQTHRRIRREARDRFPQAGWAEGTGPAGATVGILVGVWVALMVGCVALWWWQVPFGPIIAAIVTLVTMWVVPGIRPHNRGD